MVERVIAYIDGFNLYFGLKSKNWKRYYWLDVHQLAQNLLKPDQELVVVRYFTSRISEPPDKQKRQATYLEALSTLPKVTITYGRYQMNDHRCPHCGRSEKIPSEKMTDVNIAVELLSAAANFTIGRSKFERSLLPEWVTKPDGFMLQKPSTWK